MFHKKLFKFTPSHTTRFSLSPANFVLTFACLRHYRVFIDNSLKKRLERKSNRLRFLVLGCKRRRKSIIYLWRLSTLSGRCRISDRIGHTAQSEFRIHADAASVSHFKRKGFFFFSILIQFEFALLSVFKTTFSLLNKHNYFGYGIWFCCEKSPSSVLPFALFHSRRRKCDFYLFAMISKIDGIRLKLDGSDACLCLRLNRINSAVFSLRST